MKIALLLPRQVFHLIFCSFLWIKIIFALPLNCCQHTQCTSNFIVAYRLLQCCSFLQDYGMSMDCKKIEHHITIYHTTRFEKFTKPANQQLAIIVHFQHLVVWCSAVFVFVSRGKILTMKGDRWNRILHPTGWFHRKPIRVLLSFDGRYKQRAHMRMCVVNKWMNDWQHTVT